MKEDHIQQVGLVGYQTVIQVDGKPVLTLDDILPDQAPINMLIVGKTPAPISVEKGHYFQGRQGQLFWGQLKDYDLLKAPRGCYEDDYLKARRYGITDVVKVPHEFGDEPSYEEYTAGAKRIVSLIDELQPHVMLFVYKKVLDRIINWEQETRYGFNDALYGRLNTRVFVCPLPGVGGVDAQRIDRCMLDLQNDLSIDH